MERVQLMISLLPAALIPQRHAEDARVKGEEVFNWKEASGDCWKRNLKHQQVLGAVKY